MYQVLAAISQGQLSRRDQEGSVLVRGGGQRVWHGRNRNAATQGRQRLYSGCCFQSRVPFLGQAAVHRRHRLRDRAEPSQKGLAPLTIRRRDQRSTLARLGLS